MQRRLPSAQRAEQRPLGAPSIVCSRRCRAPLRPRCLHRPLEQQPGAVQQQRAAAAASLGVNAASAAAPIAAPLGGATQQHVLQPRLRVAVDVDEVLGRFVHALNAYCRAEHGMSYEVEDYWVYEFAKIWDCSQHRSNHIVHEFFKSPHFRDGIPVIPGAAEALRRLSTWCDLVVVTSRQHVIQDATLEWLDAHYPGTFQEVYFGNHFALEGTSRRKSDICASIGAHVLIDDNVGYALDCATHGIQVLLYDWDGGYPWSKLPKGSEHPNIRVVRSWREAEAALAKMAPALAGPAAAEAAAAAATAATAA